MRRATLHPLEHDLQVAVIDWWAWAHKGFGLPEYALFAVPNAGAGAQRGQAGKMKAEGTRKGIPDLLLPVAKGDFRGLAIEMKSATGSVKPEQREVQDWLLEQGWRVWVCRSSEQAIGAISEYLRQPAATAAPCALLYPTERRITSWG